MMKEKERKKNRKEIIKEKKLTSIYSMVQICTDNQLHTADPSWVGLFICAALRFTYTHTQQSALILWLGLN